MSDMLIRVPNGYGVVESNHLTPDHEVARARIDHGNPVTLNDPRLARVTRLRLVTDRGLDFYDVSYCYGELKDGTPVRIRLPFRRVPRAYKGFLINHCRERGLYAKGLGLLDESVISRLIA